MSKSGPVPRAIALALADSDEAKAIAACLAETEHNLYPVASAAELRLLLANLVPHIMILDHRLPDAIGFELCRELRDDPRTRRMSVLVLLPPAGTTVEECFISGVNDFLARPIDLAEVRRKIDRLAKVADRRRLNTLALLKLEGEDAALLGRALNVSPSGLLVEIEVGLPIGTVCEVRFNLPGQAEPVRARGVVRRRAREVGPETGGVGIEFATLGADDRGRLARFFGESREGGK